MRLADLRENLRGENLFEAKRGLKIISPEEARKRGMFGPLYHGTSEANMREIIANGFQIFVGDERSGQVSNGYLNQEYWGGTPPPIHHLGFGIYFTTSKANSKNFGSTGRFTFYIDAKPEEINFGAPRTMMNWWVENGYDPDLAKKNRVKATRKLTNELKKQHDAIWYKGKGIRRLLDGDQVAVFKTSIIYGVDETLAKGLEVGATVERYRTHEFKGERKAGETPDPSMWQPKPLDPPRRGKIVSMREIPEHAKRFHPPGATHFYSVRFDKGGTEPNVYDNEVRPAQGTRKMKSVFSIS